LTIVRIAKSGLFNLSGYTPIESAERADLYAAFLFLSSEKAIERAENIK